MSEFVLTPGDPSGISLILSDGDRDLELVSDGSGNGIWVREQPNLPLAAKENTYAESSDSEGRRRIRSRPLNGEGSIPLAVGGESAAEFWEYVDNLQELVESAHRRKGTLRYTPPNNEAAVTYDLESCRVSALPQHGVLLRKNIATDVEIEFECLPYGRLDPVTIVAAAS